MNTCDKYFWVVNHPALTKCGRQADIELTPQMVNPETEEIDENGELNTRLDWWIEVTQYEIIDDEVSACHDWELDCGAHTVDDSVAKCYELVLSKHGKYQPIIYRRLYAHI